MAKLKKPVGFFGDQTPNVETKEPISQETKESSKKENLVSTKLEIDDSRNLETKGPMAIETEDTIILESKESNNIGNEEPINVGINEPQNLGSKESSASKSVNIEGTEGTNPETSTPKKRGTKVSRNKGTEDSRIVEEKVPINIKNEVSRFLETREPKRRQNISKQIPNSKGLINQGFMVDEELIAVLAYYTVLQSGEDRDKSTVIRKALRSYIPEKYFKMYRDQMEDND